MEKSDEYRSGYQAGHEAGKKKVQLDLEPVLLELRKQNKQLERIAESLNIYIANTFGIEGK